MDEKIELRLLDKQKVQISLPNLIGHERIAMACSATLARMVGFVPERIEDLKSAVGEACVNAMQHGNKGRPEARVVVNMNFRDDTFIVSVMDQGDGMPAVPQFPGIVRIIEEEEPTRGLGVFMIQRLVDRVKFNQMTPEGHMVTMEIKLTSQQSSSD
ncbi:MAG TPA: ATP-binding protein [Desulfobacterales bacterium]|nr:ATP-binding protein [Desulfobacterales bacterium]